MTFWTLRLVAVAGLVALLGRLPAVGSVTVAFGVGVAATAALLLVAGTGLLVVSLAVLVATRHRRGAVLLAGRRLRRAVLPA